MNHLQRAALVSERGGERILKVALIKISLSLARFFMHAYGSSVSQTSLNHSLFSTITRLMFMFCARLQTSLPLLSLGTNLIITFSFLKAMIVLF